MTTVDIISGFLGAGKTTLIKKLLEESFQGQKLVLIENEFGEIGIDSGFLKDSGFIQEDGVKVNELNSGCICCSLVGDFNRALLEVVNQYQPDRIVIEPSGVGKLSSVRQAVEDANQSIPLKLGSAVAVVDAKRCKAFIRSFGEFFLDQIESAGTIILSRTQLITQEQLAEVVSLLREHNSNAAIITTPWDDLSGNVILSAMTHHSMADELMALTHHHHHNACDDPHCDCHHHHHAAEYHEPHCACHEYEHHHDAEDVFVSWSAETPRKFTENEVRMALEKLDGGEYGTVLRSKGIVPAANGGWIHFDMVPGEYSVRPGTADYTGRLCVIGSGLKESELSVVFGL